MKSRAALLLLATFVVAEISATPTTERLTTSVPISRNFTTPEEKSETIVVDTSKLIPKSPDFSLPFINPKEILLQEIQSIDEDAASTKIQEELAKAIKAEAQKSREQKPRGSTTQKPRRLSTSTTNVLDSSKSPVKANEDRTKEALKALKQEEKEFSYDSDEDDEDDIDDKDAIYGDEDDDGDDDDDEDDEDEDDLDEEEAIGNSDDETADNEDDDDDDDIADEEELMTECPDYCRCSGQYASATTARCSKLTESQNFGPEIAHLRIENTVDISLGPQAIRSRGLQQLESITIADTNLVKLDRSAFNGTDYLFAVNLSRNGLTELEPDYFVNNTQLSLLTISGQSFTGDWYKSRDYILKSPSIAELDFSDNKVERLPRAAFSKMRELAFVDLKNNRLRNIEKSVFENIDTLVDLDLSGNLLNIIPEGVFDKGLQTLRISSNNLASLGIPDAPKLLNLDVSRNHIKFITKEDLVGVNLLEELTISSNGLRRIHQHAFSELDQLTYLDISDNKLTSLNEHHLRSNSRLQVLIMNDNPGIGKLPVFKTIGYEYDNYAVYRFECANCGLDVLAEGTFDAMPAITRLNLARNRLSRLPTGLLKSMSSLRELDLSDNMINTLEPKMLLGARTLTKLNLAGNPLVSLQVTPFLQTPSLSRLDVSRCQLRRIWSEARQPLKSLRFISVRGNELKRIALEELKAMPKLSGLDASHNPFTCDEDFESAIQWLIHHGVTSKEVLTYVNNYGTAAEEYAETDDVRRWSDLARAVCDNDDSDVASERTPIRKPINLLPNTPEDITAPNMDSFGDLDFSNGKPMDGKLDDIWRDQYQEYEDANLSKLEDALEGSIQTTTGFTILPIAIMVIITSTLIVLVIQFARMLAKAKGRGPVIRPPMILRQGLVDNKNCGLVYKPLQEEIATPHMPKRGSFYSSSTFHYDKIVPESV